MIMTVLERVESLRTRNQTNGKSINKDLYRLVYSKSLLEIKGSKEKSEDTIKNQYGGFASIIVEKTINELKTNSFHWNSRQIKTSTNGNPATIYLSNYSFKQKIVQQAILLVLESIYEPNFSTYNNNFEKRYYCTRGLIKIKKQFENISWVVQGDFNPNRPIINSSILIKILRKKIQDEKFLQLIWSLVQTELNIQNPLDINNKLITLLLNIYLSEFDGLLEELNCKIHRLMIKKPQIKILNKEYKMDCFIFKATLPTKKITIVQSGEAWIVGIWGRKIIAEKIKRIMTVFLTHRLNLKSEGIKIHYLPKAKIKFIGYILRKKNHLRLNKVNKPLKIKCLVPISEIIKDLANREFCTKLGKGIGKSKWILYSENMIIQNYTTLLLKLKKHYFLADNYDKSIKRLEYILRISCAHTLAEKNRSNLSNQVKRLDTVQSCRNFNIYNNPRIFKNGLTSGQINLSTLTTDCSIVSNNRCILCNVNNKLERHNIKAMDKKSLIVQGLNKNRLIQRLNKKQSCICKSCQSEIHKRSL